MRSSTPHLSISTETLSAARKVAEHPTGNFVELIHIAGLNPHSGDLRYSNWSTLDFSMHDLRNFDFTGSNLSHCNMKGALIEGATFDAANLRGTFLEEAADWDEFSRSWVHPISIGKLHHLPDFAEFLLSPHLPKLTIVPAIDLSFIAGTDSQVATATYTIAPPTHLRHNRVAIATMAYIHDPHNSESVMAVLSRSGARAANVYEFLCGVLASSPLQIPFPVSSDFSVPIRLSDNLTIKVSKRLLPGEMIEPQALHNTESMEFLLYCRSDTSQESVAANILPNSPINYPGIWIALDGFDS